jgi:hypothetical protein
VSEIDRIRQLAVRGLAFLAVAAALAGLSACGGSAGAAKAQPPPAAPPQIGQFPKPAGRTLAQIASSSPRGPQVGLASSVFTPGMNRVAFGLIDDSQRFVYGQVAVYIAPTLGDRAAGPFLAPLDSIQPSPAFRSQTTAADTSAIKAIYYAHVRFAKPGPYAAVVMMRKDGKLSATPFGIPVAAKSAIPNVGDKPPDITTPTVESVGGNVASIDTRVPPDDMHKANFKDVVGKRPVALLFATPQLCQSRVCGPVVDIEAQLEAKYSKQMTFIHMEVYKNNKLEDGLRPQLDAFHLQTEPWLFVIGKDGRIAARLEGSFGVDEFDRAIRAALG